MTLWTTPTCLHRSNREVFVTAQSDTADAPEQLTLTFNGGIIGTTSIATDNTLASVTVAGVELRIKARPWHGNIHVDFGAAGLDKGGKLLFEPQNLPATA